MVLQTDSFLCTAIYAFALHLDGKHSVYILCTSDFRYYMYSNYPNILEQYYLLGERMSGNDNIRTFDYTTWMESNEH